VSDEAEMFCFQDAIVPTATFIRSWHLNHQTFIIAEPTALIELFLNMNTESLLHLVAEGVRL